MASLISQTARCILLRNVNLMRSAVSQRMNFHAISSAPAVSNVSLLLSHTELSDLSNWAHDFGFIVGVQQPHPEHEVLSLLNKHPGRRVTSAQSCCRLWQNHGGKGEHKLAQIFRNILVIYRNLIVSCHIAALDRLTLHSGPRLRLAGSRRGDHGHRGWVRLRDTRQRCWETCTAIRHRQIYFWERRGELKCKKWVCRWIANVQNKNQWLIKGHCREFIALVG